ncbi:MarR family transcriptional regulator [Edaphobacter sp. HDX4]|uniref:MarR family winged helix-turn-helix transcriptional regulator n=1 Tax=Edaphobacter sp. HDX4 TaxID=2794064 RepID=UPI002FE55A74
MNVLRTSEFILERLNTVLKPFDLTFTQYNVLRILRGAGDQGLICSELAQRMIARDPDITRLLDRMERRSLISRARQPKDRRVVLARIADTGQKLLDESRLPMQEAMRGMMGGLGKTGLQSLIKLLEDVRAESR